MSFLPWLNKVLSYLSYLSKEIVKDHLEKEIIEPAPSQPTGPHVFYMPHKPIVPEQASSSRVPKPKFSFYK
jgi:hypothetical protein